MISAYLTWHYGAALRSAFTIAGNFIAFALHLFSIRELMGSLFAPWRRITEQPEGGMFSSAALMAIWDNALSRVLGAIARTVLLSMGAIFLAGTVVLAVAIVVLWILGPIIPVTFTALGLIFLIPG